MLIVSAESPALQSVKLVSCVCPSHVYIQLYIFSFSNKGWKKFRCYASSDAETTASFFCISINAPSSKGSLSVSRHLKITLLSFLVCFWGSFCMHGTTFEMPHWSHLLWEDLHFLSLYYALILVSSYLWRAPPPLPPKEFYLNSVKMDPVMLTWLCICK